VLVHPNFDPVAIHLGPLAIRWYGLMYLVGFACAFWLGRLRIRQGKTGSVTYAALDDLLFYGVLGVVIGGRLGYVLFYKPGYYLSHLLEIPAVWHGGMSFHGGFLGVLLAVWWVARKHGLRWLEVTDFSRPSARSRSPPGGSEISSTASCRGASPPSPGAWFSRARELSRATLRSSTSSPWKACCCS